MKKKVTKRRKTRKPWTRRIPMEPDPDNLPPELAKLKLGELINALPGYHAALNTALQNLSEVGEIQAILAARTACREMQIIIARLIKLKGIAAEKLLRKPKPENRGAASSAPQPRVAAEKLHRKPKPKKRKKGAPRTSIWLVGLGECRKPGSHRS